MNRLKVISLVLLTLITIAVVVVYKPLNKRATPEPTRPSKLITTRLEANDHSPVLLFTTKKPIDASFSAYLKTEIGKTREEDIPKLIQIKSRQKIDVDSTRFLITSPIIPRDEIIETDKGIVVFKRIITTVQGSWDHPNISAYASYGTPEAIYKGSRTYGPYTVTNIYTARGFAIMYNEPSSEVLEIHSFPKETSVDEYLDRWGADIRNYQSPKEKI